MNTTLCNANFNESYSTIYKNKVKGYEYTICQINEQHNQEQLQYKWKRDIIEKEGK